MICGKVIYKTQSEAKDAADGMNGDHSNDHSKKRGTKAYFCGDCNGFHLYTEQKKSSKRKVTNDPNLHTHTKDNRKPEFGYIIHDPRKFKVK